MIVLGVEREVSTVDDEVERLAAARPIPDGIADTADVAVGVEASRPMRAASSLACAALALRRFTHRRECSSARSVRSMSSRSLACRSTARGQSPSSQAEASRSETVPAQFETASMCLRILIAIIDAIQRVRSRARFALRARTTIKAGSETATTRATNEQNPLMSSARPVGTPRTVDDEVEMSSPYQRSSALTVPPRGPGTRLAFLKRMISASPQRSS